MEKQFNAHTRHKKEETKKIRFNWCELRHMSHNNSSLFKSGWIIFMLGLHTENTLFFLISSFMLITINYDLFFYFSLYLICISLNDNYIKRSM